MADKKISALTPLTNPDLLLDFIPITDGTAETKKINLTELGLPSKSFNTVASVNSLTAFVGGDQVGYARGDYSLDIQSKRDGAAWIAKGSESVVVGSSSLVNGDKSYSFGRANQVRSTNSLAVGENNNITTEASSTIVVGKSCDISGSESVVYGSSIDIAEDSDNNVALGKTIVVDSDADGSVSIGTEINMQGSQSAAVGKNIDVLADNSAAVGRNIIINTVGVTEIGGWDSDGNRDGSIRCSDQGVVSLTVPNVSFAPLDGGATAGSETSTSLPREMVGFRRNADEVLVDINIGGVVKSVSLGGATRVGADNSQASRVPIGSAIQNDSADAAKVNYIRRMTQSDYNDLLNASPSQVDANTVYIIVG